MFDYHVRSAPFVSRHEAAYHHLLGFNAGDGHLGNRIHGCCRNGLRYHFVCSKCILRWRRGSYHDIPFSVRVLT